MSMKDLNGRRRFVAIFEIPEGVIAELRSWRERYHAKPSQAGCMKEELPEDTRYISYFGKDRRIE
jgi:hypothetical protein